MPVPLPPLPCTEMIAKNWAVRLLMRGIREGRGLLLSAGAAGVWWQMRVLRRARRRATASMYLRPGQSAVIRIPDDR